MKTTDDTMDLPILMPVEPADAEMIADLVAFLGGVRYYLADRIDEDDAARASRLRRCVRLLDDLTDGASGLRQIVDRALTAAEAAQDKHADDVLAALAED